MSTIPEQHRPSPQADKAHQLLCNRLSRRVEDVQLLQNKLLNAIGRLPSTGHSLYPVTTSKNVVAQTATEVKAKASI